MTDDAGTADRHTTGKFASTRVALLALALVMVAATLGAIWLATGDDAEDVVATGDGTNFDAGGAADDAPARDAATGTIRVQLESVEGIFIEGFEIGLKFETTDGELIGSTLWSDHIDRLTTAGDTDDSGAGRSGPLDPYYESVLDQAVPAGTTIVSAEVNIGIGPGPSIPVLSDDLPCRLAVDVPARETVTVEVGFGGGDDCLRVIPNDPGSPSSTAPTTPDPSPVEPAQAPMEPADIADAMTVGSSHYVDVDLQCRAFELDGMWVLRDGDTSTWQPPGERHEGGLFTIEAPDRGRFVGDAAGTKTAVFERLDPLEEPPCAPLPR